MTEVILEALARAGPLLVVALVITVGIASGAMARAIHLPGMTGQILAGVVMGGTGLSLLLVQLGVSALVGASLAIAMALTVGIDRAFQAQLFDARNAAHAYELLHGEESEDFNYFLED